MAYKINTAKLSHFHIILLTTCSDNINEIIEILYFVHSDVLLEKVNQSILFDTFIISDRAILF